MTTKGSGPRQVGKVTPDLLVVTALGKKPDGHGAGYAG